MPPIGAAFLREMTGGALLAGNPLPRVEPGVLGDRELPALQLADFTLPQQHSERAEARLARQRQRRVDAGDTLHDVGTREMRLPLDEGRIGCGRLKQVRQFLGTHFRRELGERARLRTAYHARVRWRFVDALR